MSSRRLLQSFSTTDRKNCAPIVTKRDGRWTDSVVITKIPAVQCHVTLNASGITKACSRSIVLRPFVGLPGLALAVSGSIPGHDTARLFLRQVIVFGR